LKLSGGEAARRDRRTVLKAPPILILDRRPRRSTTTEQVALDVVSKDRRWSSPTGSRPW
jgi:ABC-type transport system involved in Fe-S cluster assembly fused permease/ATPase subunit